MKKHHKSDRRICKQKIKKRRKSKKFIFENFDKKCKYWIKRSMKDDRNRNAYKYSDLTPIGKNEKSRNWELEIDQGKNERNDKQVQVGTTKIIGR